MPSLQAFNRRWNLGSDDLVFPGIVEITIRGVWLIALLVIYPLKTNELTCDNAYKIMTFYIGTLCLLAAQIILCVAVTILSTRGTMVVTSPRRHVSTLLYLRLVVFIPQIAWAILGTIWTFEKGAGCQKILVRAGKGVVLVEWAIIATILISVIFMFDPLGQRHLRTRSTKDYNQVWKRRCRVLCCCIWGDENRQGAFEEIAELLTKFFKGKDIVLTDVIAGMVLMNLRTVSQKKQSIRMLENVTSGSEAVSQGVTHSLPKVQEKDEGIHFTVNAEKLENETSGGEIRSSDQKDWMTLKTANYYCKYALGSYGSYNYVMCRNCSHRCGLCQKYRCLFKPRRFSPERVEGDNTCECQMAAVLQYTDINPDDILFANFENQIFETPYFVAVDDNTKSVIIAIRGTKTFQDAVTDLTAFGERFDEEGAPSGNVHGGMLKVARNIRQQLEEVCLFEKMPQDYRIVLTGHSLGGGAAVLLSILLRHRFPNLICFAFSPPGGLVSSTLQQYTEEFVCSVVIGDDVIPRLSLNSMEKLKYSILDVIKQSKLPKYQILISGVLAMCCGWRDNLDYHEFIQLSPSTDNLFDMDDNGEGVVSISHTVDTDVELGAVEKTEISGLQNSKFGVMALSDSDWDVSSTSSNPDIRRKKETTETKIRPTTYQQFHASKQKWAGKHEDRLTGLMACERLYLPGHIMHLIERQASTPLKKPRFSCRWSSKESFQDITVSPSMLHHHHGDVVRAALEQVLTEEQYSSTRPHSNGNLERTQPTSSNPLHTSSEC